MSCKWTPQLVFIIILLFTVSCDKFLEVDFPENQLSGDAIFQDDATALAALAATYAELRDDVLLTGNLNGLNVLMGLYSDELDFYGIPGQSHDLFYKNILLPSSTSVEQLWNQSYHVIYLANGLIEGIKDNSFLSSETTEQIEGQALFIRALTHFYLVNLFGEVPYIFQTDYLLNSKSSRLEEEEVYKAIVADLQEARIFLANTPASSNRIYPDGWAVTALLAKVYLYMEDWKNADLESSAILENTDVFSWETNLSKVFLKESSTAIWQLKPETDGFNTHEASMFRFVTGPPPFIALNEHVLDAFEEGDARKTEWIATVVGDLGEWHYASKYKNTSSTGTEEYSVIFRLAEQFLIRAEARTQLDNISGALQDVNKIRERANLEDLTIVNKELLLDAILHERRVELFTEFGNRWFDLKRTGNAEAVMSLIKAGWDSKNLLIPIPEKELLANPNLLPQNPGY